MEEESLRFWIIPIICFLVVGALFYFSLDYKINTILPNAELEKQEMKNMSCKEVLIKYSSNDYWSRENAIVGKAQAIACNPPKESSSSGLSPFVEFCNPGGFAPIKNIENKTHSFNHDTCIWDLK